MRWDTTQREEELAGYGITFRKALDMIGHATGDKTGHWVVASEERHSEPPLGETADQHPPSVDRFTSPVARLDDPGTQCLDGLFQRPSQADGVENRPQQYRNDQPATGAT
jgi:hypothetical protein